VLPFTITTISFLTEAVAFEVLIDLTSNKAHPFIRPTAIQVV
jgi:hypothetical protein